MEILNLGTGTIDLRISPSILLILALACDCAQADELHHELHHGDGRPSERRLTYQALAATCEALAVAADARAYLPAKEEASYTLRETWDNWLPAAAPMRR